MKVDSRKIQDIIEWSAMKTILKLRYFLGLADYYKQFIEVAAKNNSSFRFSKEELEIGMLVDCQRVFEKLKTIVMSTPILGLPDLKSHSKCILMLQIEPLEECWYKKGHLIAFESRKLNDVERKYSTYEKEMMSALPWHIKSILIGIKACCQDLQCC